MVPESSVGEPFAAAGEDPWRIPPEVPPLPDPPPEWRLEPTFTRPLSLRNPLDYLRLLYWVFYRPQVLRDYVAWVAPEAAKARGQDEVWDALTHPALRTLVVQALVLTVLLPFGLAWLAQWLGVPVAWVGVALGVAGGVAWGMGVAGGVAEGVALGVALGVAGGVAGGVAWGVAVGVAGGVAWGVALGVAGGVAVGVAWGVAGGMALGMALGLALGMAVVVVEGVAWGVALGVEEGAALGVAGGVALGVASARLWDLPWVMPLALLSPATALRAHGLVFWPLPGLRKRLRRLFYEDLGRGAAAIDRVLRYSLQFIPAMAAAGDLLEARPEQALPLARALLQAGQPDAVRYLSRSLSRTLWAAFGWSSFLLPLLLLLLLRRWWPEIPPYREDTPHRRVVAALARVLDAWKIGDTDHFEPESRCLPPVEALQQLARVCRAHPHFRAAGETAWRAELLARMLQARDMDAIAALAAAPPPPVGPREALAPEAVYAVETLRRVAGEVRVAREATARGARQRALLRAQDALRRLEAYVREHGLPPERKIVLEVVAAWRDVLTAAGGVLGREVLVTVIPNRFVVGPPVKPESGVRFVGREKEIRQILRFWSSPRDKPPVLLWGQRRIGKTSLLYNLAARLGDAYLPVLMDLQEVGMVKSEAALFFNMARRLHSGLQAYLPVPPPPSREAFAEEPMVAFSEYLDLLESRLPLGKWVVLAVDEFERLETLYLRGVLGRDWMEYLRSIMQHRGWLVLVLAGSHHLEEMRRDFWHPFMGVARTVHLDYLDDEAARELLTNPWDHFPLNYRPQALRVLLDAAGGHPMLLQHLGWFLVERFNERLKEDPETPLWVTEADARWAVEQVLRESEYFRALYHDLPDAAREVLHALAVRAGRPGECIPRAALPPVSEDIWAHLQARGIVDVDAEHDCARIHLDLFRRWLRMQASRFP